VAVASPSLTPALSRSIASALLSAGPDSSKRFWTEATDFSELDSALRLLDLDAYADLRKWSLRRLWTEYKPWFLFALMGLIALGLHSVVLSRLVNRRTAELADALCREKLFEQQAQVAARRISKMERIGLLGQVTTLFAHEVRQPLSVIAVYAYGLRRQIEKGRSTEGELIDGLKKIEAQNALADSIVKKVRNWLRQKGSKRELVNLLDVIQRSCATFLSSGKRRADLQFNGNSRQEPIYIYADSLDLELVLLNLLRNAEEAQTTVLAPFIHLDVFSDGKEVIESLEERITGRYSCETILDDNGEVIVEANHMITPKRAARIVNTKAIIDAGDKAQVKIRTILTCRSHIGICAKCYGSNMATKEPVQVGEAVGIIAAQSIGEPGTQLTMRTFHTGGVAGDDITQGLPRVEELFEARKPKGLAIISEFGGRVQVRDTKKKREVVITNDETGMSKAYLIPYGSRIKVLDGDVLEAGDELTEGSVNPNDIMKIKGVRAVQDYMLREVQRVYRLQGVEINDKHIEVIVRQMLKKVRIESNGDSDFLPGVMVDLLDYEDAVEKLTAEGKEPPEGKQIILGITKASLATNSFLSAASFQETTKVLTDAAIKGKVDPLIGLKENVIIGKLIPAGTGMKRYRNIKLHSDLVDSLEPPEPVIEEPEEEEENKEAAAAAAEEKEAAEDEVLTLEEDEELVLSEDE